MGGIIPNPLIGKFYTEREFYERESCVKILGRYFFETVRGNHFFSHVF